MVWSGDKRNRVGRDFCEKNAINALFNLKEPFDELLVILWFTITAFKYFLKSI
jgi:hypothetical protein